MRVPFYAAAASAEYLRARAVMERLVAAGLENTGDWTASYPEHVGGDAALTPLRRLTIARGCVESVRACSVFVLLVPDTPARTTGAWVELGVALELRRRMERPAIVVAGRGAAATVFTDLADVCCETDDEAVAAAAALASTFGGRI